MFSHLSEEETMISQKSFEQEKVTLIPIGIFKAKSVEQIISIQKKEVILKAWAKVYFGTSIEHRWGIRGHINSSLNTNHVAIMGTKGSYFLDDHIS